MLIGALWFSTAAFSQMITLSPTGGPPTTIEVSGSGFSPNAAIDIDFDTTSLTVITANASGSFSNIAIQVPASALPGAHSVSAVETSPATDAKATFTVYTRSRQLGFTSDRAGFNRYENVLNPGNVSGLELKWSYATGISSGNALVVANGGVYDNFYALKANTGALLWSLFPGEAYVVSSPAVAKGVDYIGSGQAILFALNADTGAVLWTSSTGNAYSSPAVVNGKLYVGSNENNVYVLDASTGAKLWSYSTGSPVSSPAVVANGEVYVNSNDGNIYAFGLIRAAGAEQASARTDLAR